MASTTNYSWSTPDNSGLVKNGAQDMRTLGDAIDTSLWNVGYGQAGKNKLINGDFGIWQRGTSLSITATFQYLADRWQSVIGFGTPTATMSQQSFTAGAAPVAGYESQYFLRQQVTVSPGGSNPIAIGQRIEDVRTFAGQTATLSFWAKADSARTWTSSLVQNFGSGGSSEVTTTGSSLSVTTSWTRFTQTFTLPSISGKTIGSSNYLYVLIYGPNATVQTMDIWGVQLEYGSKATPFETATGTIQGELAAAQRYFCKSYNQATAPGTASTAVGIVAFSNTSTASPGDYGHIRFPVAMRIAPTVTTWGYGGTSGTISQDSNGADQAAGSGSVKYIGENGCTIYNNSGGTVTTSAGAVLHFRADAEL
jgi:hypothetical protein